MHRIPSRTFRLSLLSVVLASGFAQAAETVEQAELRPVEVTALRSRAPSNWKSAAESTTRNFKDMVADQVGLNVGGGSVSAHWLNIRGVGQNRTDMIVDNTASSSQLWHHQSRFLFDPAMVKVVGVDKGAGSASSGIGATQGAIRTRTVDASDLLVDGKTFGARFGTTWSSNKGIGGNVAVYANTNGFDAMLMGSWSNDKAYKDGSGTTMTNTARKQGNYLAKFGYAFNEDHRIGFSYRREHFFGDMTMRPEFPVFTAAPANLQLGPVEQTQQTFNLDYKGRNVGFIRDIEANVYHIKGEDERPEMAGRLAGGAIRFGAHGGSVAQSKTTGANVNLTSDFGSGHVVKYGLNFRAEEVSKTKPSNANAEDKKDYGVYVEGIWNFAPVTLTTGLRYDYFSAHTDAGNTSASKGTLNPSIGVIYDVNPQLSLRANFNQASRSPQLTEAVLVGNATRKFAPGLKPEIARLAEIGFNWNSGAFAVNGSLYHQRTKNFINNPSTGVATNVGTLRTSGYELNAAYKYEGLTARIGTARANHSADGFTLPASARDITIQGQQWLTSLSYRFDRPRLEIGWRGRYMTGKEYTLGGTHYDRKGYGVHDIYANWQPLNNDTLNINLSVNNIGDKLYQSHSQGNPGGSAFNEVGRDFRLGINYRF